MRLIHVGNWWFNAEQITVIEQHQKDESGHSFTVYDNSERCVGLSEADGRFLVAALAKPGISATRSGE